MDVSEKCPRCLAPISYDTELSIWKCSGCKKVYTDFELKNERIFGQKPISPPNSEPHYLPWSQPDFRTGKVTKQKKKPINLKGLFVGVLFLSISAIIGASFAGVEPFATLKVEIENAFASPPAAIAPTTSIVITHYPPFSTSTAPTSSPSSTTNRLVSPSTSNVVSTTTIITSSYASPITSSIPSPSPTTSISNTTQIPYRNGSGGSIVLVNNPQAKDPTWADLMSFLLRDPTDDKMYIPGVFTCGDFAQEVHNNAEAAGIRAAWVFVDLLNDENDHSINAFMTTDKGLVYIDCGGTDSYTNKSAERDKVIYIVIGKEYGSISIGFTDSTSYDFYVRYELERDQYNNLSEARNAKVVEYNTKLAAYNAEVKAYNATYGGRTLREPEYSQSKQWSQRIDGMKKELDALDSEIAVMDQQRDSLKKEIGPDDWLSLGIVNNVVINW